MSVTKLLIRNGDFDQKVIIRDDTFMKKGEYTKEDELFTPPVCNINKNYYDIFENICEGVSIFEVMRDQNGIVSNLRINYINLASILNEFGPRQEITGKTIIELCGADKVALYMKMAGEAITTGKSTRYEMHFAQFDKYFLINAFSPNKNLCISVDVDITEHRGTERALEECGASQSEIVKALRESETKYRTIFENTGIAFMIIEEDTTVSLINEEMEKTFGYLKEEVEGKRKWTEFVATKDDLKRMEEYHRIRRMNPEAAPKEYEYRAIAKDGSIKDVLITVSMIPGTKMSISSFIDITERKKVEKELKEARDNLEEKVEERTRELEEAYESLKESELKAKWRADLLDITHDAIFVRDMDDKISFWNKGAESLYGWSEKEALGKIAYKLLHTPSKLFDEISENVLDYGVWDGELTHTKSNGEKVIVLSRWALQKDENENPEGFLEINTNITERKKAEERLKDTIMELERSNEELRSFAYITSHDLQEPLRTMASYAQLLERRYKGKLDKDADEFIEFMVSGASRMKEMIQGLLDYSRVGTRGEEFKEFNANEALNHAILTLNSSIEDNNAEITHDSLPVIYGDKNQISRVFQNLIGNAIKFRKQDEPPKIHISAKKTDNEYVFSVSDNSIGIEQGYIDQIFEVFKRLHTIDEYEGAGIGLAIVKRIIDRHGGHVWTESECGKGSTFYFTVSMNL